MFSVPLPSLPHSNVIPAETLTLSYASVLQCHFTLTLTPSGAKQSPPPPHTHTHTHSASLPSPPKKMLVFFVLQNGQPNVSICKSCVAECGGPLRETSETYCQSTGQNLTRDSCTRNPSNSEKSGYVFLLVFPRSLSFVWRFSHFPLFPLETFRSFLTLKIIYLSNENF